MSPPALLKGYSRASGFQTPSTQFAEGVDDPGVEDGFAEACCGLDLSAHLPAARPPVGCHNWGMAGQDQCRSSELTVKVNTLGPFTICFDRRAAGPWPRPSANIGELQPVGKDAVPLAERYGPDGQALSVIFDLVAASGPEMPLTPYVAAHTRPQEGECMSHLFIATIERGGAGRPGTCTAATPSLSRIRPSSIWPVRSSSTVDSHF